MRLVFGLVLLIGVGLAGAAVYLAKDYIGQQQAQLAEAELAKRAIVPTKEVIVVTKQMRYGQRLTKQDVKLVRWPTAAVPAGAFTDPKEVFPENGELRSILRTMEPDEAVLTTKVTAPGEDAGVSSRLSSGMRAFTIRTDASTGVGGFLRPGDSVDIYWTGSINRGQEITQLIDANVRIIAINQSADEDRNNVVVAKTVTVEVNPRQVALLAQAQATGRLSLSLVGADEQVVSEGVQVNQRELLGIVEKKVVEAPKEKKCFVTRRSGEERISVQIPCTN
ncbi:MAG: Flp pilus assembly protein CpaB [Silicimonas sp.]|nr:Flp pilus assembly protein CpaB [Silicimonas sp.]